MNLRQLPHKTMSLAMAIAMAGCASTSVRPEQETSITNLPRPSVVVVHKFAVNLNQVKTTEGFYGKAVDAVEHESVTEEEAKLGDEVANQVADELVKKINAMGLIAQRAPLSTETPPDALIINGTFRDIDEGNKVRQLVIGLGFGETKMDTLIQVLSPEGGQFRTLLVFETHADSGELPGAALTMGAGAAAQGTVTAGMAAANAAMTGIKAYRTAMGPMADRTAAKAATYLGTFFHGQGWISGDQVPKSFY